MTGGVYFTVSAMALTLTQGETMQTATVDFTRTDLNIIRRALIRAEFPNDEDQRKANEAFFKVLAAIAGTE